MDANVNNLDTSFACFLMSPVLLQMFAILYKLKFSPLYFVAMGQCNSPHQIKICKSCKNFVSNVLSY